MSGVNWIDDLASLARNVLIAQARIVIFSDGMTIYARGKDKERVSGLNGVDDNWRETWHTFHGMRG